MKTLVLDMGNVLFEWNPVKIVGGLFDHADAQQEAHAVTIGHSDWLALDRGTLELSTAIANAQARTALPADKIAEVFHKTPPSLTPLKPTIAAMLTAHTEGANVFLLSNMAAHTWHWLQENHDFWHVFSGFVVSCDVGLLKPEAAIYQHLLEEFQLDASATVFIDDMADNIVAANAAGIHGVHMTDRQSGGELIKSLF